MSRNIISILLILLSQVLVMAQGSLADVFENDKRIVWYGLDFTKAKFIGTDGFSDPNKIVTYYFTNWNELVNNESEKYDVRKAIQRRDMEYVLGPVRTNNEKVDPTTLVQGHLNKVSEDEAKEAVQALDLSGEDPGVGMCLVVENFDKPTDKGSYWLVFFDISSKSTIHIQKIEATANGFGFRNHWAKSFKGVLEKIEGKYYRKWRKANKD